jgi:hypothetical protein
VEKNSKMKRIITISILLINTVVYSQSFKRTCDSLTKLTSKKVVGYSITFIRDRESFIIFYENKRGEMNDQILYIKKTKGFEDDKN